MRKHRSLFGVLLIAGLLVAAGIPARAATPLTFDDPAGDSLDTRASMDIVKVSYDVRQVNKSGPPSIVIEMTLSAAPESQLVQYRINANQGDDCRVDARYAPGTLFATALGGGGGEAFIGCGDASELVDLKTLIKGNVITMSFALDTLPKPMREAGELKNFYAFTQTADPLLGLIGNGDTDATNTPIPTDSATTDKTFKFA